MSKVFTFLMVAIISFNVNAQSLYFPPITGSSWDSISPQTLNWCQSKIDSLYAYLETNSTKAFILLKDGKIVLEKYIGTHTQTTLWQWASAGKTITSFMVGIAQQEGHLSITDTTSDYLGTGWTNCLASQEEKITIRHQLTMTTGLDDGVANNHCTDDTCLIYKADAGSRWAYHNAPYTLLGSVISSATGMTLNNYTTQKLKNPTGMTGSFVSLDDDNVFFSNARSMARFGLLILNKGNWNGNQLLTDTAYYNQMTKTSQSLNKSYGYLWWLNGEDSYMIPNSQIVFPGFLNPNAPADVYTAMGKDGQFLNIVPSQNMVWVRMGESPESLPVPFLMNDKIWEYINNLECSSTTGFKEQISENNVVEIFPNPGNDILKIIADHSISKVELLTINGQIVKSINTDNSEVSISINEFAGGIYFVKVSLTNGAVWTEKLIKK